ncbi:MAG: hypothetical protein JXB32_22400 [Deltaproteobacteria bacterium]|nr:hypothetical protein [Deltaproteobacteria bacterium]
MLLETRPPGTVFVTALLALALSGPGCYSSTGGDDDDTGDVVDARPDDGGPDVSVPPFPTRFVLRLVSDIPETLYVAAWEASSASGHWLTLRDGGTAFRKAESCGICDCDECPACALCGAPCAELSELVAGTAGVEYLWDGRQWTTDGACGTLPCEGPEPAPAGTYSARFCWGTARGGTLPCDEILVGETCADVSFTLPDPDGVVEYAIDNGG